MEVKESEKLNNIKLQPSALETFLKEFKLKKAKELFYKDKSKTYWLGIIASILFMGVQYYFAPESQVKAITVSGNYYLTDDKIKEAAELSLKSRYYLVLSPYVEDKIKELGLIDQVKVTHKENNVLSIEVIEKQPFGYRVIEDTPELLLSDGSVIPMTSSELRTVADLPLIRGFEEDEAISSLARAFSKLTRREIESISEINQFNLNYDDHTLECLMVDGNYFFSSYFGLPMLVNYYTMTSELEESGACIFADDSCTKAIQKACPWDETPTVREYWTDEAGNYIYDKYGDRKVKHYYQDDKGFYFLDKDNNKIPIPIDENAEEHKLSIDDLLRYIAGEMDQWGNELNPDGTIKTEEQKALEKLEAEAAQQVQATEQAPVIQEVAPSETQPVQQNQSDEIPRDSDGPNVIE
ncbi:MAG: FtsQ-type POTRA domain-containing protein [Erysipelotrichaceae bacterium]|nr:FtsQ-type POTRA domain-containing protein [Erysipelotrichaceae bacterium]